MAKVLSVRGSFAGHHWWPHSAAKVTAFAVSLAWYALFLIGGSLNVQVDSDPHQTLIRQFCSGITGPLSMLCAQSWSNVDDIEIELLIKRRRAMGDTTNGVAGVRAVSTRTESAGVPFAALM